MKRLSYIQDTRCLKVKENVKTSTKDSLGLHEQKEHEPWFDDGCLDFVDQRKQAKMQWVQDPSQCNVDNLNNARHEASKHFRNKKKEYLNAKVKKLETNSKIKNIKDLYRSIIDFKKGYQLRTDVVKDEKGDMVTDSYSILARWGNHIAQPLIIHGFNDVRQTEIHIVPELSVFEL